MLAENKVGIWLDGMRVNLLMYADDAVLLACSAEGLRRHLISLWYFCNKWNLSVNTTKTKVSIFGKDAYPDCFRYGDIVLEKVHAYKYLCVWITTSGSFNMAQKHLASQSKKAIFALKKTLSNLGSPPVIVTMKLYEAMIRPIYTLLWL